MTFLSSPASFQSSPRNLRTARCFPVLPAESHHFRPSDFWQIHQQAAERIHSLALRRFHVRLLPDAVQGLSLASRRAIGAGASAQDRRRETRHEKKMQTQIGQKHSGRFDASLWPADLAARGHQDFRIVSRRKA